jgi:hypothetical protein
MRPGVHSSVDSSGFSRDGGKSPSLQAVSGFEFSAGNQGVQNET